jgi:hypothetical protein
MTCREGDDYIGRALVPCIYYPDRTFVAAMSVVRFPFPVSITTPMTADIRDANLEDQMKK